MNAVLDPHGCIERVKAGEAKVMRQSTMGSADICLKRAGYDLDPSIPGGTGEARIVGTAYHAGLEEYYLAPGPSRARINEAAYACFQEEAKALETWETSKGEAWERIVFMLDRYFVGGWAWDPPAYVPLGVEQEWFLPLTERWVLKGTIDLVMQPAEADYVFLVDHKTAGKRWPRGKEEARKNTQAVLYAWAWWQLTGQRPVGFYFDVMTYKGELDRRFTEVTPEAMEQAIAKAIGTTRVFDEVPLDLLPTNTSSVLCSEKWCDHWNRCPAGAALSGVSLAGSLS